MPYYYGVGSDSYSSEEPSSNTWVRGDDITITTGGSITLIGFKCDNSFGLNDSDVKIALYKGDGSLHEGGIIAAGTRSVGWNDFTLVTPYSAASSEVVKVVMLSAGDTYPYISYAGGSGGLGRSGVYASFPYDPHGCSDDKQFAVRVFVGGGATGTGTFSAQSASISATGTATAKPAYGYTPADAGELSTSWTTWKTSAGGAVTVVGDANYGDVVAPTGEAIYGPVVDTGDTNNKTFTVSCPKYGTNAGGVTVEYRGQAASFAWNDGSPAWTTYTTEVTQEWRYFQVRCTGA